MKSLLSTLFAFTLWFCAFGLLAGFVTMVAKLWLWCFRFWTPFFA